MSAVSFPVRLREVADDLANDRATPRAASTLHRRHAPLSSTTKQLRLLASVRIEQDSRRVEFETLVGDALKIGRAHV